MSTHNSHGCQSDQQKTRLRYCNRASDLSQLIILTKTTYVTIQATT